MKCTTKYCKNSADSAGLCYKCISRKRRAADPVKASYYNLKANAKRRGKEFSLTLEEFKQFCVKTEYLNWVGRGADSYHVDRIDETKGYHVDNIQVLTNRENKKKWLFYRYNSKGKPTDFRFENYEEPNFDDVPF